MRSILARQHVGEELTPDDWRTLRCVKRLAKAAVWASSLQPLGIG